MTIADKAKAANVVYVALRWYGFKERLPSNWPVKILVAIIPVK